jgi:hypothetical protein
MRKANEDGLATLASNHGITSCLSSAPGPLDQAACRDGMRLAALEFYWEHRDAIQVRLLAASLGDEIATAYRATASRSDDYLLGRCKQIKTRLDSIRQCYPDFVQALTEGLALLTFEGSHIQ